jgi:hypothetical protein
MMKRALIGILAATVVVGTANAQSYRRYGPARSYTPQGYIPQSSGSVRQGVRELVPFPTQTVRKPPAAGIPATIQESTTDDIGCSRGQRCMRWHKGARSND